jgi:hypothetical protein
MFRRERRDEKLAPKPNESAYVESFNGKFLDECGVLHLFLNTSPESLRLLEAVD